MLPLPCRAFCFGLLLLCLPPLTCAQTPTAKPAAVPQVRLQVDFVSASKTDVDNLGVAFGPVLLTTSASQPLRKGTVLGASTDKIVTQLFQTLTRMRGSLVSSPIIVTDGKMPVTFSVNTQIRYHPYRVTTSSIGDPRLEETVPMPLQAALIVTPHVNSDGSVTLTLVPQAGDINASPAGPRATVTQTIASGQMLVLSGLPTSKEKPTDDQELLVFITPTIVDAPPQVRLQVDFASSSKSDIDNLGVLFEPDPIVFVMGQAMSQPTHLQTATGKIVSQLYQTLTRTRGTVVHTPAAVTPDNVPAKFMADSHVIYYPYRVTTSSVGDPRLRQTKELPLQASITITPHVSGDGSVILRLVTEAGTSTTQMTPNGQMLALEGIPLSKEKPTDDQELLVFITPTVLNADGTPPIPKPAAAPVVDTRQTDPLMPDTAERKTQEKVP